MSQQWLNDVELKSTSVKLVPLSLSHANGLINAVKDGELDKLWFTSIPNESSTIGYIETALDDKKHDKSLAFAVVRLSDNKVIGSTRFCNAEASNRRIEIGYTWYAQSVQRTAINTECKLLMLTHAFEHLKACVVVFRTHYHNQKSRNAILRLGAKQDGILRNHQIINGLSRDTVVFSILENEWPVVKQSLSFRLK